MATAAAGASRSSRERRRPDARERERERESAFERCIATTRDGATKTNDGATRRARDRSRTTGRPTHRPVTQAHGLVLFLPPDVFLSYHSPLPTPHSHGATRLDPLVRDDGREALVGEEHALVEVELRVAVHLEGGENTTTTCVRRVSRQQRVCVSRKEIGSPNHDEGDRPSTRFVTRAPSEPQPAVKAHTRTAPGKRVLRATLFYDITFALHCKTRTAQGKSASHALHYIILHYITFV